jgi:hypothetical protein
MANEATDCYSARHEPNDGCYLANERADEHEPDRRASRRTCGAQIAPVVKRLGYVS